MRGDRIGIRCTPVGKLRIDRTHPLARGLIGCWVPGAMGGVDVAGTGPTLQPDTGKPPIEAGPEGLGLKSGTTGNNSIYALSLAPFKEWSEFSIFWRGFNLGSPVNYGWLAGVSFNGASTPYSVAVLTQSDNLLHWQCVHNSGGTGPLGTVFTPDITTSGQHSIAGTWKVGAAAGTVKGYLDGVEAASGTFGASAPTSGASSCTTINSWGGGAGYAGRNANAICNICTFWNRALSAEEMAWLDKEPYSFLLYDYPILRPSLPSLILGNRVIDYGLSDADSANKIILCSAVPTSYAEANSYALGSKDFGVGNVFSAIEERPDGRAVTVAEVTDGSVATSGVATCWAIVDDANQRLLATGPMGE